MFEFSANIFHHALLPSAYADSIACDERFPRLRPTGFVRGYNLAACLRRLIRATSTKLLLRNIS
ncbi:MAG: hypothetical protein AUG51_14950 [Acidobacteria bacterium 13_1_20CM_3_53_8]|nr:MAG: hypothetical protein AUG51_14950 [Acidobacteria bacterium 13_1_20CM_3_53_8]